jgi:drug/metabolite transporter (DMT)-like permease
MTPYAKGALITLLGVTVISPDALLIRLMTIDSWSLIFWRGLLSGLAILITLRIVSGRRFNADVASMGWNGVWVTIVFALGSLCFVYAITHTYVANTLFLTATSPIFAALISRFIMKEHVTTRTWVAIGVTMVGIGVIASDGLSGARSIAGDIAALGAALSLAITFCIARAGRSVSMVPAMGFAGLLAALMVLPLTASLVVPTEDWLWLGILGVLVIPAGFALLSTGPRYLPAPDVSLMLLLESVLGPLLVWAVLDENPGERALIGGAIVLLAMAASNVTALRDSPSAKG